MTYVSHALLCHSECIYYLAYALTKRTATISDRCSRERLDLSCVIIFSIIKNIHSLAVDDAGMAYTRTATREKFGYELRREYQKLNVEKGSVRNVS